MKMLGVSESDMPGLFLVRPRKLRDERGWFSRTYCAEEYAAAGLCHPVVQQNHSGSRQRVIRGLHARAGLDEAKFVRVLSGSVFDVVVDLRPHSATFLQTRTFRLSADDPLYLRLPPGCAHGFQVLSLWSEVLYGVTAAYDPAKDVTIAWNDPDLAIAWPLDDAILSERDLRAPSVATLLPRFDDWFREPCSSRQPVVKQSPGTERRTA